MTILEPCLLDRLVRGILSDMRRRGDGRYLPDSRPRTRRRPYGLYLWPLDVYEAWSRLDKASDKVFWILMAVLVGVNVYTWSGALGWR